MCSVAKESTFWAVSDPSHKDYGKHLTMQEAAKLLRPPAGAGEAVVSWLKANGVTETNIRRPTVDMFDVDVTVGVASGKTRHR